MQLKWPFMLLLLLPIIGLFVWRRVRPIKRPVRAIAESASLGRLPSYQRARRRALLLSRLQSAALLLLLVILVLLAARPQQSIQKVDFNNSRDVVLCLDVSGSMKDYLDGALKAMAEIVKENPTDRYGLVLFQNVPYAALPLTSDVAAITAKTQELAGFYNVKGISPGFGYDSKNLSGTDIGAGLAGCIRRFNDLDKPRSRHIIMLSDMDNNGSTNQTAVAELLPKYGIKLYVLAPAIAKTTAQKSPVTQIGNASVAELDATGAQSAVRQLLTTILNQQRTVQYVLADDPYPYWIAALVCAAAWGGLQFLRWRLRA